jgi:hypothetical protein
MQPVPSSEFLEAAPRTWPKVLGILGILWGFIGAITSTLAVAGVGREAQPELLRGGFGSALSVVGLVLAIMVLVAGVQLLRRRASGVELLRAWAPLTALVQGLLVVLMFTHRPEFERAYREQLERDHEARAAKSGEAATKLPEGMEKAMFAVGAACGGVTAIVPSLVVAIFVFGARGREAVAEWSAESAN